MSTLVTVEPVGALVRRWRLRRRRSQLDVALAAGVSARHISYIETGRANPSVEMLERLSDVLDVPLRDRNALHHSAGFAPAHPERPFEDLGVMREAVNAVLTGHEPNPALAVNVRWEMLSANRTMMAMFGDIPEALRTPPVNMLRATLHPGGMAARLRNYEQWRSHLVRRVERQLQRTAAPGLAELLEEISAYPAPTNGQIESADYPGQDLVVPMVLASPAGDLRFCYALTVFGAPRDVSLDEVAIETFFPVDATTTKFVRSL